MTCMMRSVLRACACPTALMAVRVVVNIIMSGRACNFVCRVKDSSFGDFLVVVLGFYECVHAAVSYRVEIIPGAYLLEG
ncbi:hypothetical protein PHLGIDRAFT_485457 [Phlebiopsis gigantea 11061_1 CR5-6]|uniref:Uncharacterized protein n=1 Tax=Phlebiopsis gigantea (strain 11061_1 CR5-6) TaxID=745531 RepID=A0A0C3RW74_PHLG1|nr:hypothetical protein PHLGIDRAFT_485457 [Phlebiopsis gigantea 11061_1 CR5-6]